MSTFTPLNDITKVVFDHLLADGKKPNAADTEEMCRALVSTMCATLRALDGKSHGKAYGECMNIVRREIGNKFTS